MKTFRIALAAALALGLGTMSASADYCSGRSHTGATVGGAVGGGLIGGLASHGNGLAIVGGAVAGGLIGNAIARDHDCREYRAGYGYRHNRRYYAHRRWERDHYHYW